MDGKGVVWPGALPRLREPIFVKAKVAGTIWRLAANAAIAVSLGGGAW